MRFRLCLSFMLFSIMMFTVIVNSMASHLYPDCSCIICLDELEEIYELESAGSVSCPDYFNDELPCPGPGCPEIIHEYLKKEIEGITVDDTIKALRDYPNNNKSI